MSLPEWLLEPEDLLECQEHGTAFPPGEQCQVCYAEAVELYADERISEGRYRR